MKANSMEMTLEGRRREQYKRLEDEGAMAYENKQ